MNREGRHSQALGPCSMQRMLAMQGCIPYSGVKKGNLNLIALGPLAGGGGVLISAVFHCGEGGENRNVNRRRCRKTTRPCDEYTRRDKYAKDEGLQIKEMPNERTRQSDT